MGGRLRSLYYSIPHLWITPKTLLPHTIILHLSYGLCTCKWAQWEQSSGRWRANYPVTYTHLHTPTEGTMSVSLTVTSTQQPLSTELRVRLWVHLHRATLGNTREKHRQHTHLTRGQKTQPKLASRVEAYCFYCKLSLGYLPVRVCFWGDWMQQ